MPFHPPLRPSTPASRWRVRFFAFVLGGLLLTAFDCAVLLHGPGHAQAHGHAPDGSASASAHDAVADEEPSAERPVTAPVEDSCAPGDHNTQADSIRLPSASAVAPAVAAGTVAVRAASPLTPPRGPCAAPIVRSCRSTLSTVCRWRI